MSATKTTDLKSKYQDEIRNKLKEEFKLSNEMQIPRLHKIVINMGVGEASHNSKLAETIVAQLTKIAGQKALVTKAKKSIASYKLREGMPIGCKVTLRSTRMYEFLERLINMALPRVRDFHGISGKNFDGKGNFAFGIKEQIIFPEINYDKVENIRGMDICICTSAKTDEEAKALLTGFNLPYKK